MYEIIYMRADYEPWWQFDGWEEEIVERWSFAEADQAIEKLEDVLCGMRGEHANEAERDGRFWAFWSKKEVCFCEHCDEDLQLYHGVITMKDGQPSPFS
ncbi:DUF1033 family protein [Bhargavaea cecembensis]|uniref:DUF1033 family protein n=1 Tax=Bhargavaea cecembensis TaxID=394098 RepID=UPI00058C6435|nr:DUF1033 family protein [Bhargavaea cecembensis]